MKYMTKLELLKLNYNNLLIQKVGEQELAGRRGIKLKK